LNQRPRAYEVTNHLKLLDTLSVAEISAISKLSKSYIYQVKEGKRPPSKKLQRSLYEHYRSIKTELDYYKLFMMSRQAMAVSLGTLDFYRIKIGRFLYEVNADTATRQDIETFLLQFENLGNRHAFHRAIQTFYNWRHETYDLPSPVKYLKGPKLEKLILPSLSKEQVNDLLEILDNVRDRAIIAMFTESGLRLSELVNVCHTHIDWDNESIRIFGKGRKESLAPLGKLTQKYLEELSRTDNFEETSVDNTRQLPDDISRRNIWHMNKWGVVSMLRRLEKKSGYPCNAHVFRRTFACLLRKAGVDVMTIKDLGRWESLEMVQRYTRTVTFQDSLKFYKKVDVIR
jgi:integrase